MSCSPPQATANPSSFRAPSWCHAAKKKNALGFTAARMAAGAAGAGAPLAGGAGRKAGRRAPGVRWARRLQRTRSLDAPLRGRPPGVRRLGRAASTSCQPGQTWRQWGPGRARLPNTVRRAPSRGKLPRAPSRHRPSFCPITEATRKRTCCRTGSVRTCRRDSIRRGTP